MCLSVTYYNDTAGLKAGMLHSADAGRVRCTIESVAGGGGAFMPRRLACRSISRSRRSTMIAAASSLRAAAPVATAPRRQQPRRPQLQRRPRCRAADEQQPAADGLLVTAGVELPSQGQVSGARAAGGSQLALSTADAGIGPSRHAGPCPSAAAAIAARCRLCPASDPPWLARCVAV